jgi:hypothetical protein
VSVQRVRSLREGGTGKGRGIGGGAGRAEGSLPIWEWVRARVE